MPSLGPVRNVDAQSEHQNTTLDHSYYVNRALLDGFFMSGVGTKAKVDLLLRHFLKCNVQNSLAPGTTIGRIEIPDPLSS